MKESIKTISLFLIILFIFSSCGNFNGNKDKTIDELIEHLNENGVKGIKSEKFFTIIGAIDGCGYDNENNGNFSIEIYKYNDKSKISDLLPYRNGYFGMMISNPTSGELNKKIINAFESF